MIWNSLVKGKSAEKNFALYAAMAEDSRFAGEIMAVRFTDGEGGGCTAEGALLGAKLSETSDGQQLDLELAGDDWRVW